MGRGGEGRGKVDLGVGGGGEELTWSSNVQI